MREFGDLLFALKLALVYAEPVSASAHAMLTRVSEQPAKALRNSTYALGDALYAAEDPLIMCTKLTRYHSLSLTAFISRKSCQTVGRSGSGSLNGRPLSQAYAPIGPAW
ncbi:hypothetical protein HJFPF1_08270 [Paramyrothecium foliicola]|nr:hypothetical protein HJFPF1_08270 [Paramyrothecium foliicola]